MRLQIDHRFTSRGFDISIRPAYLIPRTLPRRKCPRHVGEKEPQLFALDLNELRQRERTDDDEPKANLGVGPETHPCDVVGYIGLGAGLARDV